MIHHNQLSHIRKEKKRDDYMFPYYEGYSLLNTMDSILNYFGAEPSHPKLGFPTKLDQVGDKKSLLFFLIDGFAYFHYIKNYRKYAFLNMFARSGDLYPMTSVFPSTTSAALTAVHTGQSPQEHGLPEWRVYFEEFDRVIETLPFRTPGVAETDEMLKFGGKSEMLFQGKTLYEKLADVNIKSYVFIYKPLAHTVYSQAVHKGSILIPFEDSNDLAHKLAHWVVDTKEQSYFFVYWGSIDSVAHHFGPGSAEHSEAMTGFFRTMEQEFLQKIQGKEFRDTLLMFTADHGHVNIKSEDIINLNEFDFIETNFKKGKNGEPILPTGSPHDVFLYIENDKVQEVLQRLRQELIGTADVLTTDEAMDLGLFGLNERSAVFRRRIGNIVILPYNGYHVWYQFLPDSQYPQLGIHGGLSEEEMTIPLGIIDLNQATI